MKEKIISVALIKFSQNGYSASLSDIANEVGIKKQSLYNYFDCKEALFKAVVQNEMTSYLNFLNEKIEEYKNKEAVVTLKELFYSTINYFDSLHRLNFWRVSVAIEKNRELNSFDKKDVNIFRNGEKIFIEAIFNIFLEIFDQNKMTNITIKDICRTYLIMIHGVLDAIIFYDHLIEKKELIDSVWITYWSSVKNYVNNRGSLC